MPSDAPPEPTEVCPGCGAVLVRPAETATRSGTSASCARLFEVTLRGLREDMGTDTGAAATLRLADAAYDAQHADPADPDRLGRALDVLGVTPGNDRAPDAWRTTIADVAADLDVIDLTILVEAWARAVIEDRTAERATRQ